MNKLSLKEIKIMLEDRPPEEILEKEAPRLSEESLKYLENEAEMLDEVDALMAGYGESFRENLPPAPPIMLPDDEPMRHIHWLRRKTPVSNGWMCLAAALLILGVLEIVGQFQPLEAPLPEHPLLLDDGSRSANIDLEGIVPLNEDLFNGHLARGVHLMDMAGKMGDESLYKLALPDFLWAYDLKPNNKRVLQYLARLYEQLGDPESAEAYLEKSISAEQQ